MTEPTPDATSPDDATSPRDANPPAGASSPRFSRRTFLAGTAGAVVLGAGAVVLGRRVAGPDAPPAAPAWWPTSPLFTQDVLRDADDVLTSGGRLSAAPTVEHGDADHARFVTDEHATRLAFPGPLAGLVVPAAGLLPRDGWTFSVAARNASGRDLADLEVGEHPPVLLSAGGALLWLLGPGRLAASNLATGQTAELALEPGDWPDGAWRRVALRWDGVAGELGLGLEDPDPRAGPRLASAEPAVDHALAGFPAPGADEGVMLGGSPADEQPFELWGARLDAGYLPLSGEDDDPQVPDLRRVLRVDADDAVGPWSPGLAGVLSVHAGFQLGAPSSLPEIRDAQFRLVLDDAAARLVRVGGPLDLLGLTRRDDGGFDVDWSLLDDELDLLLVDRPQLRLHLTLDYTPEVLRPEGEDHRAPPTDPDAWATLAADVVDHVVDRYGDQVTSVTLWNEPDYDVYWTGTDEQLHDLWGRTQTRLLARGSARLLGTPEYAFDAGFEGFLAWLGEQPPLLRGSLDALYVHDFQQDLHRFRQRLRRIRAAADAAGVGPVPLRITEYNLALGQIVERRQDDASWYATQRPRFTTEHAAAYAVHLLWEALDEDPATDMAVFAAMGTNELFWGEQGLTTSAEPVQPYPALSTIAALARLDGQRVVADASWPAVRALATRDDDGAVTVVYASYRPWRGELEEETFTLELTGLPDPLTWRQWRLDRDHLGDDGFAPVVAEGDASDLPTSVTLGAVGVGAIRIEPGPPRR
ncbi:hypothetical protein FTX61_04040 [Nitriliruptoraceae bacterium ZYF776]|nr:hypothetical protein [Profundirhabdus halotolerans]